MAGGNVDTIKVWDLSTGQCKATLTGHTSYVNALAVLNANEIASGSRDDTIKVWRLR